MISLFFAVALSIVSGALSVAYAGEATDAFAPIKASTEADPAGMQLMFISIGILVFMVLLIFGTTIFYMTSSGKKRESRSTSETTSSKETDSTHDSDSESADQSEDTEETS